jgi:hypothetical protein
MDWASSQGAQPSGSGAFGAFDVFQWAFDGRNLQPSCVAFFDAHSRSCGRCASGLRVSRGAFAQSGFVAQSVPAAGSCQSCELRPWSADATTAAPNPHVVNSQTARDGCGCATAAVLKVWDQRPRLT